MMKGFRNCFFTGLHYLTRALILLCVLFPAILISAIIPAINEKEPSVGHDASTALPFG